MLEDVKRAVRLADGLDNVDFIMSLGLASDCPVQRSERYHFAAMMENSSKPIMFTACRPFRLQAVAQILEQHSPPALDKEAVDEIYRTAAARNRDKNLPSPHGLRNL